MPSEKSRYMNRNRGPEAPFEFRDLRERMQALGIARLSEIVSIRSQYDDVLQKILMGVTGLRFAESDWGKAKAAVDYAFHFPDYVRHTEQGHEQIIEAIRSELEYLVQNGQREFALRIAAHAIERSQAVADNFEEDFDWTSSLEGLEDWAKGHRTA